nr:MAG TPA: hypothetical protein [Caudoviricetes sp.]DAM45028.1 MAG TPA: hypothetical protein [Caudoviricetes sp.]DAN46765.1 MAG TPA: hypothetical protein [Caudoviricetes sp.]
MRCLKYQHAANIQIIFKLPNKIRRNFIENL